MRATHRLIGCALCIAGIGGAAATSLESQNLDNSPQAMIDSASSHDGDTLGGGDATGLTGDCTPAASSGSSIDTSGSHDRSGSASSAPSSTRRPHLGWQSLLPGSIQ